MLAVNIMADRFNREQVLNVAEKCGSSFLVQSLHAKRMSFNS